MDFVEICNVCAKKAIIKAAKRIINSDKMCHSYSDLNFGVTFLEHSVYSPRLRGSKWLNFFVESFLATLHNVHNYTYSR